MTKEQLQPNAKTDRLDWGTFLTVRVRPYFEHPAVRGIARLPDVQAVALELGDLQDKADPGGVSCDNYCSFDPRWALTYGFKPPSTRACCPRVLPAAASHRVALLVR